MAPTRTVGSSTRILPLINAGHVSSIWHDILLMPPPPSANSFAPRHPGPPFPACTFSFVCRAAAKSPSAADRGGSQKLRRRDDPLFLREKRVIVLGLDGSRIKVQTDLESETSSPSPSPSPSQSSSSSSSASSWASSSASSPAGLLAASPWNLGILPQTCVLASRSMSMFSRWDAANNNGDSASGGSDGRKDEPSPPPVNAERAADSLLTACDNVPLEALEIGSQARDPGDAYEVFPLLAIPLRLQGSGRNSMPISWRIVTIAADDELVTSEKLKHSLGDLLDRVREWATKSESFGEIAAPGRSPNPFFGASHSLAEEAEGEAEGNQSGLEDSRAKGQEKKARGGVIVGGTLTRISRMDGRDSMIGRVALGAENLEEEWGMSARESEEAERAEQAARQAREAEQAEQAKEAEQTVLHAHSTQSVDFAAMMKKNGEWLQNPESAGRRAVSAAKVAAAAAAAAAGSVKSQVVTGVTAAAAATFETSQKAAESVKLQVSSLLSQRNGPVLTLKPNLPPLSPPVTNPSRPPPLTPSSQSPRPTPSPRPPPITTASRSPPLTPSSQSPRLASSSPTPPLSPSSRKPPPITTPSRSPSHTPSSQTPPLAPLSRSPPLTPSSQSPRLSSSRPPPITPSSRSPPHTPSSRSPGLTLSSRPPPLSPSSRSPPLAPSPRSPRPTPPSRSPPLSPPSQSPPSHFLISSPSSHYFVSVPSSNSLVSIPSSHSLISIPSSHSLSLLHRLSIPLCSPLQPKITS
ncbi:unnamed protein product [Closterium sp. Yama58-4]|nr:unnamed protein product [Closterium sp. Yama58-4]